MSSFFERHKRKSLWALLLLFLTRGRLILPLLLAVLMLAFAVKVPAVRRSVPWADKLGRKLDSILENSGAGAKMARLASLLRHGGPEINPWTLTSGRGVEASYKQKGSSLDMVKGIDLSGQEMQRAARDAKTIAGVVSPEASAKMANGVPLDPGELLAGLVRNANAGEIAGGLGAVDPGALAGGRALSPEDAVMPGGMRGYGVTVVTGSGFSVGKGSRRGKLSSFAYSRAKYSISGAIQGPFKILGGTSPTYKLAEARAYSCAAAPPDSVCPPKNNCPDGACPGEYASYMGGAPFVGAQGGGLGLLALDNDPVPLMPDAKALQSDYNDAATQQACSQGIGAYNNGIWNLDQAFKQCCQAVEQAWQACQPNACDPLDPGTWGCCLGFGCGTCNDPANMNSGTCENNYMSGYNRLTAAENGLKGRCAKMPGVPAANGGLVQDAKWIHCNPH